MAYVHIWLYRLVFLPFSFMNTLKLAGIIGLSMILYTSTYGQGCVAIRSGCGAGAASSILNKGDFQLTANTRYFHSYKHFRGKHEETYRVEEGSEVINDSYFADLLLSYGITNRLSFNTTLPYANHLRSSMYEHGGNPKVDDPTTPKDETWAGDRHTTHTSGLGDIRFSLNYAIFTPARNSGTALSVGLGVKLASGNFRATDKFYNAGTNKDQTITSGVDQSIQLGDGGFGISLDIQGSKMITEKISINTSLFYLSNPREQYTLEARGSSREYSVPDQYAARLGGVYMLPIHGFSFYAGGRLEGIPSSDLIGGDKGFRRPGYVISTEPGISYGTGNWSAFASVPIVVERNRTKNYTDKINGTHGDAAFADYLLNFSITYRISKKSPVVIKDINPQSLN